jgi:uncharacterized protein (TIGR03437 family)
MVRRFLGAALVPLGFATLLHAAPMLRLVNTAVVPVPLPAVVNGGTQVQVQVVEAYNAGDGSLSLAGNPTSSVSWITTSYGPSRACTTTTASATCIPLQLTLNTSTLAAGTYTGSVTVNGAANVVDAPQTITVTVRIGGVDLYVAPGSSRDVSFSTHGSLNGSPSTQDGGRWLSLAMDGVGSFLFTFPYRIHLAPQAGMAPGTPCNGGLAQCYYGSLVTSSLVTSSPNFNPADNQTIPVTMRVTTQPIAQPSENPVTRHLAQGAAPLSVGIALSNLGQGSLTTGTVTATGGSWLTASPSSGGAMITLDPGALAPGPYSGSVSIASNAVNAVNGTVSVPVSFQVVPKGAPLANYKGVVDNAIFGSGDAVAPGDIVDVFGEQFLFANIAFSPGVPLATQIAGSSVLVNGRAAPLYFSSYGQIAFQVPLETAVGTAQVQVQRDGLSGNTVSVQVLARAPRILVIVNSDGSVPNSAHPAKVGDTLVIYSIGLGPTNPAALTGAPAPEIPLANLITMPTVYFGSGFIGSIAVTPSYSGLSPDSVGLYQVNATVPEGVRSGLFNVSLIFPDSVSNTVQVAIQ